MSPSPESGPELRLVRGDGEGDGGVPRLTTPFHDLDEYIALPRMSGLVLSPDGSRLVTQVSTLNHDATKAHTALWEVYPTRAKPARRLTRSAQGESGAAFTPDGDLLFTSSRPNADAADDEQSDKPALWVLPAGGGEARIVASRPGGVTSVRTARSSYAVVFTTDMLAGARDAKHDEDLRKLRKEKKVDAILHDGYPVRYWDHDLGPDAPHLLGWHFKPGDDVARSVEVASLSIEHLKVDDLTPSPGQALREAEYDLSPDGTFVVSTWRVPGSKGSFRTVLVRVDLDTQQRTVLVDDPDADLGAPVIAPDGSRVAFLRESITTPTTAPRVTLHTLDLTTPGAEPRTVVEHWDRWVTCVQWLPDASGLVVTADQDGRAPVFAIDLASDTVEQLTHDDYAYSDLQVAPDASVVYALRASYLAPAHPVRIHLVGDAHRSRGTVTVLRAPAPPPTLPGTLTEVSTSVEDSDGTTTTVRGWLALPDGADADDPAPLLLWIHGGPLGSWNSWSWRWNPWLMVAQGYAVLLPDPALSTGYGQDFIQRGWGRWGAEPYTDLMAITDAVVKRDDIDETRTAAMGGSFGGYMANWVAGQTDRFRAIVTHASLWALDQFGPTTDVSFYWAREMTPEMAEQFSPHRNVANIVTPMLVIHGDKDYRVPIGEGLRLWYELLSESGLPADEDGRSPHRFLYFPNENHWILSPQHAKVWYQVVSAFLAEHVLGEEPPALPDTLG